jgi:hypothetical protein
MAPKYHPTPLSGGDRKALRKELTKARGVTLMLARQSDELRAKGEALIRDADKLSCESWNERMWAVGEPIDPSPTVDQALSGGFPWLEIECSRCRIKRDVSLAELPHIDTTCIHDLATACAASDARSGKRPLATLLQLAHGRRHAPEAP